MKAYPTVLSEDATLDAVLAGRSLARIGDGEINVAKGFPIKSQVYDRELAGIVREVIRGGSGPCLAAIPAVGRDLPTDKANYAAFCRRPEHVALYGSGPYGSAFISRPDCAPQIDAPDYWAKLRSLWAGRDVVLVRGSGKSLTAADLGAAAQVREYLAPPQDAWAFARDLLPTLSRERRRVLLCLGPSATALAWRLAAAGVHAIDLGSVGRFMRASRHAALP